MKVRNLFHQLQYALYLMFILLPITACSDDTVSSESQSDADAVTITVNVPAMQIPVTRSIAGDDGEAVIRNLEVLVFGHMGLEEHVTVHSFDQSGGTSSNLYEITFKVKLSTSQSATTVAIVANMLPEEIEAAIYDRTNKEDILAALIHKTPAGEKWNATSYYDCEEIPMYGETEVMGIYDNMHLEEVGLKRMLARIDVANNVSSVFKLNNVLLYNYNTAGLVAYSMDTNVPNLPDEPGKQTGGCLTYVFPASQSSLIGEIYTYEAAAASGNETDDSRINATCIVFEGEYEGNEYYYRVDFVDSFMEYMPILRNHLYTFTITEVSGVGFSSPEEALQSLSVINNLKTELLVVDLDGIDDISYNGQNFLGSEKDVVLPATAGTTEVLCATDYSGGWEVDASQGNSGVSADWLTVAKNDVTGKLEITTTSNNGSCSTAGEERSAIVYLKAGRLTHSFNVTQEAYNASTAAMYVGMFAGELQDNGNGVWAFTKPLYIQACEDEAKEVEWSKSSAISGVEMSDTDGRSITWGLRSDNYTAANACFKKNTPTPSSASDLVWYLPAQKQLMASWAVANSFESTLTTNFYWAATELTTESVSKVWATDFRFGRTHSETSSTYKAYYVRCVKESNE